MTLQAARVGPSLGPVEDQLEDMQAAFAVSAAISLVVVVMARRLPDEVSPDAEELRARPRAGGLHLLTWLWSRAATSLPSSRARGPCN